MPKNWKAWVKGIVAALISGASTGVAAAVVAPEVALLSLCKIALIGGVVGVAGYLKQSPLPPAEE